MKLKSSLLILNIFLVQFAFAQNVTVQKAREMYFSMDEKGEKALTLYTLLNKTDIGDNAILLAYKGASMAASAGVVSGVKAKLEYFSNGKKMLESAVASKPLDAEIRFLRLATQLNAPSFLGYTGDIDSDKNMVINTMNIVKANHPNAYLYQQICKFLLIHGELTAKEKPVVVKLTEKFK